jgi:Rab GDP dissociation inhibitor
VYGGLYMLRRPIDNIVYENGVAVGVEAEGVVCRAKCVIGDPSYFQDKASNMPKCAQMCHWGPLLLPGRVSVQ